MRRGRLGIDSRMSGGAYLRILKTSCSYDSLEDGTRMREKTIRKYIGALDRTWTGSTGKHSWTTYHFQRS